MHAVDIYGLSEVIGPGVAQESVETKDGLHVWEDHFYPEIIDPVTHEVLPDGEEGELVFTSLTKEAMPVVRVPDARPHAVSCPARHTRRTGGWQKVTGRSDDMMIVRGVNVFPTPDRGADPPHRRPDAALPLRADAPGTPRHADGPRRGAGHARRRERGPSASARSWSSA